MRININNTSVVYDPAHTQWPLLWCGSYLNLPSAGPLRLGGLSHFKGHRWTFALWSAKFIIDVHLTDEVSNWPLDGGCPLSAGACLVCDVAIRSWARFRHRQPFFRFFSLREYDLLSTISSFWYHLLAHIWNINRAYSRPVRAVSTIPSTVMWTSTCREPLGRYIWFQPLHFSLCNTKVPESFTGELSSK